MNPIPRLAAPLVLVVCLAVAAPTFGGSTGLQNPILFGTQVPIPADFATSGSTFANHSPRPLKAGRGGDLYVLYPDGTLRNLTLEAGFGDAEALQGAGRWQTLLFVDGLETGDVGRWTSSVE